LNNLLFFCGEKRALLNGDRNTIKGYSFSNPRRGLAKPNLTMSTCRNGIYGNQYLAKSHLFFIGNDVFAALCERLGFVILKEADIYAITGSRSLCSPSF
jgi:hypothetical protein